MLINQFFWSVDCVIFLLLLFVDSDLFADSCAALSHELLGEVFEGGFLGFLGVFEFSGSLAVVKNLVEVVLFYRLLCLFLTLHLLQLLLEYFRYFLSLLEGN